MPKQTLLDMTQEILSAMSSDEVNSIGDTTESMQVATIIKRKYYDIAARSALPEQEQYIQLTPSTDTDKPVLMFVPDEVTNIQWIKYFDTNVGDGTSTPGNFEHDLNVDLEPSDPVPSAPPGYIYVTILPMRQFIDMINSFNPNDSNVQSYTFVDNSDFPSTQVFYYKNDMQPRFCTIISNQYVLFDSFDSTQDDTLQSSKTLCWGMISPMFRMEDDFIPDLNDNQFPLLVNEAKALAFYELKQQPHVLADREIKRQWSSLQKGKSVHKLSDFDKLPDFGRRGPTTSAWYGNRWRGYRDWGS